MAESERDPFDNFACINGELIDKSCAEMTDQELADFIEQGAWRRNAFRSDDSAEVEAALRGFNSLRKAQEVQRGE
ncbi:MAG TPA: hypothetical protein VFA74_05665 [Terriglobales bacterium]|nr:hypothetical protein [Terriglobales bacterium]